jgi:hypothetical protein
MTDESTETRNDQGAKEKRSRRAVLAGALGIVAAEVALRTTPAEAADNDTLLLGTQSSEMHRTTIVKTGQDGYAVIQGNSTGSDPGLLGNSPSGVGVYGFGAPGLEGVTSDAIAPAVFGNQSGGGPGVKGQTDGEGSAGVWGDNPSGAGVRGTSDYIGVHGHVNGAAGYGVYGVTTADGSIGVYADAGGTNGTALDVNGPAAFSLSGVANIAAGANSKIVTGVSLRPGSLVLATVQNNIGVWVASAVPNASKSKFTIHLNAAVPTAETAKVAWFVVG